MSRLGLKKSSTLVDGSKRPAFTITDRISRIVDPWTVAMSLGLTVSEDHYIWDRIVEREIRFSEVFSREHSRSCRYTVGTINVRLVKGTRCRLDDHNTVIKIHVESRQNVEDQRGVTLLVTHSVLQD
jgi:hypothetical protein